MKTVVKIILAALLPLHLLSGCSIKTLSDECPECEAGKTLNSVMIELDRSEIRTKNAALPDSEIASVVYYVFSKERGFVDTRSGVGGELKANFFLPDGTYDFYAFVNCENLQLPASSGLKVEELMAVPCTLEGMSADRLVMTGCSKDCAIDKEHLSVRINVLRIAAKVSFNIGVELNADTQGKDYIPRAVYMTNVQGANNLGLTSFQGSEGKWYNKRGYSPSAADVFLYSELKDSQGKQFNFSSGKGKLMKGIEHDIVFYVFPNNVKEDSATAAGEFTPRYTRFVLEVMFDGKPRYYPTSLPQLASNKYYIINQTLHTLGYDNPEGDGSLEDMTAGSISVVDWGGPVNVEDIM